MVGVFSLTSLVLGASLAYFASRARVHVEVLETISGAMLIAGLALVGSALPVVSKDVRCQQPPPAIGQ